MTYKHILYKHVKVHMTGNYSEWVQGMMEHHRVQKNPWDDTMLLLLSQICRSFPSSAFVVPLCLYPWSSADSNDTEIHVQEHFLIETCSVP